MPPETGSYPTAHTTTQSVGIELRQLSVHLSRGTRAFRVHPRLRIGLQATKIRFFARPSLHRKIPFLTLRSETGSTTGWGAASSVQIISTTQSSGIELRPIHAHLSRGTRAFRVHPRLHIRLHATKKQFLPVCLCIQKFRSPRPGLRRSNTPGQPENLGSFEATTNG